MLADNELTYEVIGCFRRVYNELGYGFLESGYAGALAHDCSKRGLRVDRELSYYDGVVVANYRMDLIIDRRLIVEIKACKKLLPEHLKQVLHYVRATDLELALLFNFGMNPEVKRFTMHNSLKKRRASEA
jgi:GxxExxY protein